jgi:endo-1,4-beta-xylanase
VTPDAASANQSARAVALRLSAATLAIAIAALGATLTPSRAAAQEATAQRPNVSHQRVVTKPPSEVSWRFTTRNLRQIKLRLRSARCSSRAELILDGRSLERVAVPKGRKTIGVKAFRDPGTHKLQLSVRPGGACRRARVTVYPPQIKEWIPIGAAIWSRHLSADPAFGDLVANEFDFVVPENDMKWAYLQPRRGVFDFTLGDRVVDFARSRGIDVGMGHVLVWHVQNPGWLWQRDPANPDATNPWTREELIEVMREHITTVVRHYRGAVPEWDVVNEAITENGSYRKNIWYRVIGPDYIELAFRFAHQADPDARLYYNDYGTETANNPHSDAVYRLLSELRAKGVPVHGVGFQTHVFPHVTGVPTAEALDANFRRFAELGLGLQITEMDVAIPGSMPKTPAAYEFQARIYRDVARACQRQPACQRFTTWGATDRYSWLNKSAAGLPFDTQLQPKPAWRAMVDVLRPQQRGSHSRAVGGARGAAGVSAGLPSG